MKSLFLSILLCLITGNCNGALLATVQFEQKSYAFNNVAKLNSLTRDSAVVFFLVPVNKDEKSLGYKRASSLVNSISERGRVVVGYKASGFEGESGNAYIYGFPSEHALGAALSVDSEKVMVERFDGVFSESAIRDLERHTQNEQFMINKGQTVSAQLFSLVGRYGWEVSRLTNECSAFAEVSKPVRFDVVTVLGQSATPSEMKDVVSSWLSVYPSLNQCVDAKYDGKNEMISLTKKEGKGRE